MKADLRVKSKTQDRIKLDSNEMIKFIVKESLTWPASQCISTNIKT